MTVTPSPLVTSDSPTTLPQRLIAWIRGRITEFYRDWTKPEPFDWRSVAAILVITVAITPLFLQLKNLGFEWYHFDLGTWDGTYPPWMPLTIKPMTIWDWRTGLAILTSLLFASAAVGAAREAKGRTRSSLLMAALMAVTAAPVFMLTWLGNTATVALFGVIALPWGIPFASIQPHISSWAILARRRWTIYAALFLGASFIIWGWWPPMVMGSMGGAYEHPIAMGWSLLGWPILAIGLIMLVFSKADPLQLMAAGVFITPYLMPVHMVLLVPAIGRARGWWRLVIWLATYLTLFPPMFGPALWSKYVAMLFPFAVWWMLRSEPKITTTPAT